MSATKVVARAEHPQFRERAVFEAFVNVIAHRDYSRNWVGSLTICAKSESEGWGPQSRPTRLRSRCTCSFLELGQRPVMAERPGGATKPAALKKPPNAATAA